MASNRRSAESGTMAAGATTLAELAESVLAGELGPPPSELTATSAFWLRHTTRLAGSAATYLNHYVLLRVGGAFGASSFETGEVAADFCEGVAGRVLAELIADERPAVRVAALDAYLGEVRPHRTAAAAQATTLPAGTPEQRAAARDAAVAGLLDIEPGARVALIGVVNPLVAAIRERGGVPLPCDFNLRATAWGDPVAESMATVLAEADAVVATGMTLSNGTFDPLLSTCRERGLPLVVYAQTGSAVVREFLGAGVTALSAEPFPFSQFSAETTTVYRYRA
ncbi:MULTISPECIES: Rossmann-like domain-containing protein [Actinoalloteichus]|uniref:DUF364 family protein n=1 Tax=Actinoalloteichus fjordicus TaxID=1612552 RepID=A0AAC9LDS3_9PSEU|nr:MULTISPECIES: DUF364 domain-containing protein [Actinoalloteichus]APU14970.1 putative DUF364 family protein [Actinoalloteichus fjordicus]APU21040.1 putative DUF364 family protein [Actinoalloteichus sp. GBA129-24]